MGAIQLQSRLRPEQVMLLRLFQRGGVALLALAWLDRPVGEGEIAAILDIDRKTARSHLASLVELGIIARTAHQRGYYLTTGGQMILSGEIGKFSPFLPSSTASS